MTQFNFTTNIEKRMPTTGEVFCIDRMTSDYAEQHPFDVDGFIESVYQEFAGTEFEESRETLHSIWTAVLSVTSPRGDASLYPNKNNAKSAAAIKVWTKAGDYWRRGLRNADTLPDMVPMCKITRLDDGGWIALFPKDKHLLMNTNFMNNTDNIEPARNQPEPRQLDLFAMQEENEHLRSELEQMKRERTTCKRKTNNGNHCDTMIVQNISSASVAVSESKNNDTIFKAFGLLAAASVAVLVIWQTGLIIPLGLIGLATSGFIK